jgi:hypothetical protein
MEADEADGRGFFYGHECTNYFEKMFNRKGRKGLRKVREVFLRGDRGFADFLKGLRGRMVTNARII